MKKFLVSIITCLPFFLLGQCDVEITHVEWLECQNDNIFFNVFLDTPEDHGGYFNISANDIFLGEYDFGEDQYLMDGLIGDCETQYTFTLSYWTPTDTCTIEYTEPSVACCPGFDCPLFGGVLLDTVEWSGDLYTAYIDGNYPQNVGSLIVKVNDLFYETVEYDDFPLAIYELEICEPYSITVCLESDELCCDYIPVPAMFCGECVLDELETLPYLCTDEFEPYLVLESEESLSGDGNFNVIVGDMLFTFPYGSTSYEVGPLSVNCNQSLDVLLYDEVLGCETELNIDLLCCDSTECYIPTPSFSHIECDEEYLYIIDLVGEIYLEEVETINFWVNDGYFFDIPRETPTNIAIPQSIISGSPQFTISLSFESYCTTSLVLENPCWEQSGPCDWQYVEYEVHDCNPGGEFQVNIWYGNTSNDGQFFVLFNNDSRGPFSYSQQGFIEIGGIAGDCETIYDFTLVDAQDPCCSIEFNLGEPICCDSDPCNIGELQIENVVCTDGHLLLEGVNLYHDNASDSFNIVSPDLVLIGTYAYADLPISTIAIDLNYVNGPVFTLLICDQLNEYDCFFYYDIEVPCEVEGLCIFDQLFLNAIECEDGVFYAEIFYPSNQAPPSNTFSVFGNGVNYGEFDYTEDYRVIIGPLEADCITLYEFVLVDNAQEVCSNDIYFDEPICCEDENGCLLDILEYEVTECNENGLFDVILYLEAPESDCPGFNVIGNGQFYGFFEYPQDLIYIENLEGDCETLYEFVLIEECQDSCFTYIELEEPVCCGDLPECSMESVSIEYFPCEEDEYFISIEVNHSGLGDSYHLYLDNEYHSTHDYGGGIDLGPFQGSADAHDLLVIDSDDPGCSMHIYFGQECDDFVEDDEESELVDEEIQYFIHDNIIEFSNPEVISNMRIFDANGKVIEIHPQVNDYQIEVDFPSGMYFIEMFAQNKKEIAKMVIAR